MRTIILGAGTTGTQLARRLTEEGRDVALIERDPDATRVAANALDCLVVQGDGSSPEVLAKAGTAKARHFIALTGSDELNIVCCSIVAAEYPGVRRIARVRNAYFTELEPSRGSFMGIDRFVNPDIETARAFLSLVSTGADEGMLRFSGEDLLLRSSLLGPSSPFVGRPLRDSRADLPGPFLVAAVEGEGGLRVPSGDTVPEAGQTIYILGSARDLDKVLGTRGLPASRYRRVVIAGAGPIGTLLAEGFLGSGRGAGLKAAAAFLTRRRGGRGVVVVDPDFAQCKRFSRQVPGALVINRDLEDEELFLEEGLSGADLFIAVTPDQGLNILSAARAKLFGVQRSLALAENNAYAGLTEPLGVDGVISLKSNVVSSIVEYLRGGVLTTLHSFFDRGLKILEFSVGPESRMKGSSIRELRLPKGALVIFVRRSGKMALPAADTRLEEGDRLGIFTSMDDIRKVEALFLEAAE